MISFSRGMPVVLLLVVWSWGHAAHSLNQEYRYFEDVITGLGIDPNDPQVWDIGNAEYSAESGMVGMMAYYKISPRLYENRMCVLESRSRIAEIKGREFSWGEESIGYQVWISDDLDCNIQRPEQIPEHSLVSGDVSMREALTVLSSEDYLFQEVLNQSHHGQYNDWGTYKLIKIGKTNRLRGAVGKIFIEARFNSPGKYRGPVVYLQLNGHEIIIERIGSWMH